MRFKKTSLLVKLLLLAICVYCVISLISLQKTYVGLQRELDELQSENVAKVQTTQQLADDIAQVDTPEGIRKLARDRLGYVENHEILFLINDN